MSEQQPLPPVKLAFVIDDKVIDLMHTDNRLAAVLMSNPVIIDVTGPDGRSTVQVGDIYNPETNTFTVPQ